MLNAGISSLLCLVAALPVVLACSVVQPQAPRREIHDCYSQSGDLADTLVFVEEVPDIRPPTPRLRHLAPYPPASGGEHTIAYRNSVYYASGPLLRLTYRSGGQFRFVKIDAAGPIPLYVSEADAVAASFGTVVAPVTGDCVFLPFRHESEMR